MTRKEYLREYKIKNRARMNAYNRIWMRMYRNGKIKTKKKTRRSYVKVLPGTCYRCGILLKSKYALKGNDDYCGDCLLVISKENGY